LALIDIARRPARRAAAVVALAQLGDSAVPLLAAGFDQFDLDLRRAAVEVLARIRSADAIRLLETALDDNSPSVRHAALSALARIRQFRRTA
jgi:HEAT repeat protein